MTDHSTTELTALRDAQIAAELRRISDHQRKPDAAALIAAADGDPARLTALVRSLAEQLAYDRGFCVSAPTERGVDRQWLPFGDTTLQVDVNVYEEGDARIVGCIVNGTYIKALNMPDDMIEHFSYVLDLCAEDVDPGYYIHGEVRRRSGSDA